MRKMNVQSMQPAIEFRNPLLQIVSTFGIEKHISPTYTMWMEAEISFVTMVPTYSTTQQNFQKGLVL